MWAAVVARARVRVRTSLFSPLLHGTPVYRPLVRRRSSLVSLCAGGRRPDDGEIPSLLAVAVALSYVRTSTSARHIAWQGAPAAGFQLANVALDPSQESEVITMLNKCSNTTVHQRENLLRHQEVNQRIYCLLFVWLISQLLFSQNTSAQTISHQPNELGADINSNTSCYSMPSWPSRSSS
jgi:hypothetical protein